MKLDRIKIAALIWLLFSLNCYSATDSIQFEKEKRHIVSRFYDMTETMAQKCEYARPTAAKKYKQEVARFTKAYPKLMILIKNSPYYSQAQKDFAYKGLNPWDSEDTITSECEYFGDLIEAMIDDPRGSIEVNKFEQILSK